MSKGREFDHSKYSLWIDPNEVKPYERNAKIHDERQIANIANSIRRFGWQQDTVITRDKVCVIGHGRRLAAIQLGCEMPYHIIDKDADEVTEDDIRELRIADNRTNSETGYNNGVLDIEIEDLDFDGFDFSIEEPNIEFADFDGLGDGGGSMVATGTKVRIVIGAAMFDIDDDDHAVYAKTKKIDVSNWKAWIIERLMCE